MAVGLQEHGHHAAAAAIYDLLEHRRPSHGEFYFNQGSAHFLAGNLPQAILAYRRAEQRMLFSTDLRANLADASSRVTAPPEAASGWHWPPLGLEAGIAGYLLYMIGWTLLAHPSRRMWRWLAIGALLSSLLLFAYFGFSTWSAGHQPVAVISADGVVLRKGNGPSYAPVEVEGRRLLLNRGVEARALAVRSNGWVQIRLASDVVGWAPRAQLLLDHEPP